MRQGTLAADLHTKFSTCLHALLDNLCSLSNTDAMLSQCVTSMRKMSLLRSETVQLVWILRLFGAKVIICGCIKGMPHKSTLDKTREHNSCFKQWFPTSAFDP